MAPGIAHVRLVPLTDPTKLDVVAGDMIHGRVLLARPWEPGAGYRVLTNAVPNPAHAEVVDLDLVVANLGTPSATC